MNLKRTVYPLSVFMLFVIAVISRLKFHGLVYDFDYGIYQPDGSHYAFRTLTLLGINPVSAAQMVVEWYEVYGFKRNLFDSSFLISDKFSSSLVSTRFVYSLLSVPFVAMMGIPGMMVIPVISFMILIFVIYRISRKYNQELIGFLILVVVTNSPTVLRWMISNLTDSLLTALFALSILFLDQPKNKLNLSMMSSLVMATSFTRFCLPIWLAIGTTCYLRGHKWYGVTLALFASLFSIPSLLAIQATETLLNASSSSNIERFITFFKSIFTVLFIEIAQLGALDRLFLGFLVLAVVVSLKNYTLESSQLYIAVLSSVWFIGALNGTLGVNFRYQLPVIAFGAWTILDFFRRNGNGVFGRRIEILRGKP
jgi:hypothetical protein